MKNRIIVLIVIVIFLLDGSSSYAELQEGSGKVLNHSYEFKKGAVNKYAVRFEPFLPRNDRILITAMLEIVNRIYGKHQITNLKPSLIKKDKINYVMFEGEDYNYLFLLFKENTGEVWGFSVWREKK